MESVCNSTLRVDNDPSTIIPVEKDKKFINFTLANNTKYYFEISNAAGTWTLPDSNFSEIHA